MAQAGRTAEQLSGLSVRYASFGGSGTTVEAVAAVTGKQIVVVSYVINVGTSSTIVFASETAGNLSGAMTLGAGVPSSATNAGGLFATTAGEALDINFGTSVAYGGHLAYLEV